MAKANASAGTSPAEDDDPGPEMSPEVEAVRDRWFSDSDDQPQQDGGR